MKIDVINHLDSPGLAGMICRWINNRILVYGGSYFPNNDPLKSSKVQSNKIRVYDEKFNLLYEQDGKISPDKGITIEVENEIYYILGSSIYRITIGESVEETCIGNFDFQLESGYGCYFDGHLFFGFQESYLFNIETQELFKKSDFPVSGRGQGLSVKYQNELYYLGGANNEAYLDGYKYSLKKDKWEKLEFELPSSVLGASSIQINESGLLILGGFNEIVYNKAVIDLATPGYREEYFSKGRDFFNWNRSMRILDLETGKVKIIANDERFALCGAGFLKTDNGYYVVSGECSPGRRTSDILLLEEEM
ncbi:TPA: cyclically-permuted mutarotase family protein [Streptococcus pneumoniae]|nr:cyclically-permuted mutarotase family protein [Streptococcus pneumoniae]HEW9925210.1 cyclically-permuted mutarotase family protein [Streptococcus pneumoniae]